MALLSLLTVRSPLRPSGNGELSLPLPHPCPCGATAVSSVLDLRVPMCHWRGHLAPEGSPPSSLYPLPHLGFCGPLSCCPSISLPPASVPPNTGDSLGETSKLSTSIPNSQGHPIMLLRASHTLSTSTCKSADFPSTPGSETHLHMCWICPLGVPHIPPNSRADLTALPPNPVSLLLLCPLFWCLHHLHCHPSNHQAPSSMPSPHLLRLLNC